MKPLITIVLAVLVLVVTSCASNTDNPQDTEKNDTYQEAWRRLLEGDPENDNENQPDMSNLETEQKFRIYIREGTENLAKYMRMEDIERNLLNIVTNSDEMRLVLERQQHYLRNAFDCFSQALLIHADSFVAHQGIALTAAKMGKYDTAIEHASIVLEGSESRTMIYRVLVQAYQRKAMLAKSKEDKVLNLSKAALYIERYSFIEKKPDIHLMTYTLALIHAEIAANLTGPKRAEEYQKAAAIIDNHLARYPEILSEGSEMAEFAKKMQAASARFKNTK